MTRILIAGYQHETNTFAPSLADWAAFQSGEAFPAYVRGQAMIDQMTGVHYYLARISIPRAELAKLNQKRLVPGMPAEIYVRTQNRTVLSYLFKPIEDQMERAFRER